ncbi:hypothetical protein [Ramlibacter albus]|uniref:Uncharacterized protein n=1 Tax=Ramlibacter albus TaxID=2079448 RepID=A0A923M414_9BURK|nr:hypothetical protein [Ramlibacter albus]MBC5763782.1 hypothetical protein [Ramlibacter albus]
MTPHRPSHWIILFLVVLAALFTLREVQGQTSTNARSQFEGMPSMAGAQAGTGAQAGPPQGGLGVQGSDAAGLRLMRPRSVDEPRSAMRAEIKDELDMVRPQLADNETAEAIIRNRGEKPARDTGMARDTGGTTRHALRSVRRAAKNIRHPAVAQL